MQVGTNESQKLRADYAEAISVFRRAVGSLRLEHSYSNFSIANMEQTMVCMDCSAKRMNNVASESNIRIVNTGCARRGLTVALCATAADIKLPALVVLKELTGQIPPRALFALQIPGVPENVRATCSGNGWMTTPVFLEWVRRVWGANKDDVRLVLDQVPTHKTEAAREVLDGKETDVFIPGGCTSILQPADVCWMKPFKCALRTRWSSFLWEGAVTAKGNLKMPSRQDVISFVSEARASLSEEAVLTSFKRCGISTRLDGSGDGELNHRLASVSDEPAMGPEARESMVDEAVQLVFDSDSDASFDGFSDDE
ncbi:hypothetical protein HPB47_011444 [Ixodes persulcatus]|uniref:Uncharacterized protein n=1 Tax=Ixodes persulcatus TaxID=34615 RepID=A0AC60NWD0_IXOPE|nr:hypothetical protein HPB47_011444 [Ixodes persulcatus]